MNQRVTLCLQGYAIVSCYWKHAQSSSSYEGRTYHCIDGTSIVCARCCVEECAKQSPDFFQLCASAGHPTWPSVREGVANKLVCLESSWDDVVFSTLSIRGFLEGMGPLLVPPLRVAHRFIESAAHLAYYTAHPDGVLWRDPEAFDTPIYYLAFHGAPGQVCAVLDRIKADALCKAFKDFGDSYRSLLYFGSCSTLDGTRGRKLAEQILEASGCEAVIGYTTDVDWMDSLIADMTFLYRFYSHADPWGALREIMDSVHRDFRPAAAMGLTMIEHPKRLDRKAARTSTTKKPTWKHGDIVRARYGQQVYDPARVIRIADGIAVVHWGVDETFSEIPVGDIVGASRKTWSLEKVPEDLDLESISWVE